MWAGRFEFGDGWAVYRGPADANTAHRHAAIQIAVAREGMVGVRCGDVTTRARTVIIPSMVRHELLSQATSVTAFYLEAEGLPGRALRTLCPGDQAMPAPPAIDGLLGESDPPEAMEGLSALLAVRETGPIDPRLSSALACLRHGPGAPGAVGKAAKAAGISAPRLRELARAELGVALSQWLLWQKLARASHAIADGAGLAEAAATGGFADQAHFARTMRRMFGVTPRIAADLLA
ncbi:helix-turn-helix- domain containing protein AraC type [Parvibaculum lavamentivorans DS-1]|uniref:Helix-turn-helix-domain containing protein AraC type n=2 Tax=Parvibaculum lavamentivorans TaxID=256618 RepID=A7HWN4_PARL1|nr:helix-turn-helix- domain containing protein AraC type [Parvibaculum lavamentivorans DS-1]